MDQDQRKKLLGLTKNLDKKFGKGAAFLVSESDSLPTIERIPIKSPRLSWILGGGIPKGRIIELFGIESGGKTSLACMLAGDVQRNGGTVGYIDAEHAIDIEYAKTFGFTIDDAILSQPDSGEQAFDIAIAMAESEAIDLIIVDSVAALTPMAELNGEMGDMQMGAQARLMGKGLRKIASTLSVNGTTLILLNQVRASMAKFGSPEITPGGKALKFYASIRLEIRKIEFIIKGTDVIGLKSRIKTKKNKTAPPMRKGEFEIIFGDGFQTESEWAEYIIQYDIIKGKPGGSWFDIINPFNGDEVKVQGKTTGVTTYLDEHPDFKEWAINETKKRMFPNQEFEEITPIMNKEEASEKIDQLVEENESVVDMEDVEEDIDE